MALDVAAKIDGFFSKYPKRAYPKGQILIFGGSDPEHVHYIAEGRVRVHDISPHGDELAINILKAPAFFPMGWAINGGENPYFYKAETDTVVHLAPPAEAVEFIKQNPDVLYDLLARLYRGTDGLLARTVQLMTGTATSRLLQTLVIESQRFGKEQKDGSLLIEESEGDIAARSGLTRETVSREIAALKKTGLVQIGSQKIIITDLAALEEKLADFSV